MAFATWTESPSFWLSSGLTRWRWAGYYFVAANVRLDGTNGRYFRVSLKSSLDQDAVNNGLHVIRGIDLFPATDQQPRYQNLNPSGGCARACHGPSAWQSPAMGRAAAGIILLPKSAQVSVWVYSEEDTAFSVQHETGFSAVLLREA
jgi:hypothetical protein